MTINSNDYEKIFNLYKRSNINFKKRKECTEKLLESKLNMSFIEGKTLKHCIEDNKLGQKEKQIVLDGIIKNLLFLSQNGIIHGDLKPDNIIIKSDLSVEIIDFRSAMLTTDKKSKLGPGAFLYRAPELLKMEIDFDSSADVYSLGLIVFFMESGIAPIEFDKSLNPADALENYFGLAHSPQIRWLVGALSNPDKNSRATLQQIVSYSHFTDCDVNYFPTSVKANQYNVDLLYSEYRNGCQYSNPLLISNFYNLVAVDGNIAQHQKNMCLELCLNGVSSIDDSISEYILDLYSYQNNLSLDIQNYINYYIAYNPQETTKKIINAVPYINDNETFAAEYFSYLNEKKNYDRDAFLQASLLYSNISHRIKLLIFHLTLCDSPTNEDFFKIDQTIDPYDAAYALYGGELISINSLFLKYHHQIDILSMDDKFSRFADYFHLINIFPDLGDQVNMSASTLSYEATDPYQVLQIIGSHIPPELWNFADLCILIQVIYTYFFLKCDEYGFLTDGNKLYLSGTLLPRFKIEYDPQIFLKGVKLFKQLLFFDPFNENLLYSAFVVIRKFYVKYSYLHYSWISFISERFDQNMGKKLALFKTKYLNIISKMFESNYNPNISDDSWQDLMINFFPKKPGNQKQREEEQQKS